MIRIRDRPRKSVAVPSVCVDPLHRRQMCLPERACHLFRRCALRCHGRVALGATRWIIVGSMRGEALSEAIGKLARARRQPASTLTRGEVAKRLNVSIATVRRMEGVTLHPTKDETGAHRFDPREVATVASTRSTRATASGEIAARACELFREGKGVTDVVIELRQPFDVVQPLFRAFVEDSGGLAIPGPIARQIEGEFGDGLDRISAERLASARAGVWPNARLCCQGVSRRRSRRFAARREPARCSSLVPWSASSSVRARTFCGAPS